MVPSSFFRHSPIPLHISTARAKPPCPEKSRVVRGSQGWALPHVKDPDGHELRFYAGDDPDQTPTERTEA